MKHTKLDRFGIGLAVATFVVAALGTNYILHSYVKLYNEKQYADMITCSDTISSQIYDRMMPSLSKVMSLAEIVKHVPDISLINSKQIEGVVGNTDIQEILLLPDNKIDVVFPKNEEAELKGLEYKNIFGEEFNFQRCSAGSRPYIVGPFTTVNSTQKLMASIVPIFGDNSDSSSYWGCVAVLIDYEKCFSTVGLDITEERGIFAKVSRLDEYTGETFDIMETNEKFPENIPKGVISCTKFYFTTPFIVTLFPKVPYYKNRAFLFFTFLLIILCFVVPYVVYAIVNNFKQNQELKYYKIQAQLVGIQEHTIISLSSLVENRDSDTGAHIIRTSDYVYLIAREAKKAGLYLDILTDDYIEMIKKAAPMHDIGKIVIPDSVLKKPGKLTDEEFDIIKSHTVEGGRIIEDIIGPVQNPEFVKITQDIATAHHEKWNGKGYPYGLKEEAIPLAARIMALADVFDALTTPRCYKEPFSFEQAIEIIKKDVGTHFDPKLAEVFLNNQSKLRAIMEKNKD